MKEISPRDSILIDKHLLGELTRFEQGEFERRILDDTFAKEVEFRSSVKIISQQKGDEKLLTLLEEESKRIDQVKLQNRNRIYHLILALIALAGLCYFLFSNYNQPSQDEIFYAHYEPFPNLITPTQRSTSAELMGLELALYAYDNGQFQEAAEVFDTLSSMTPEAQLYHAISCLEVGQYDRAEQMLVTISADKAAKYHEAADWYLCLLQIKITEKSETKICIKKIIGNKTHKYRIKAIELNSALD